MILQKIQAAIVTSVVSENVGDDVQIDEDSSSFAATLVRKRGGVHRVSRVFRVLWHGARIPRISNFNSLVDTKK